MIEVGMDTIRKKFQQEEGINFYREVKAYKYFNEEKVDFVPKMISYNEKNLELVIEKINGYNLLEYLKNGDLKYLEIIIEKIVRIDSYLYLNKINVLHISPKDIIISLDDCAVYLVDFEYTFLGSDYKQILYDKLFHKKIKKNISQEVRNKFFYLLKKKKSLFLKYYSRSLRNFFVKIVRLIFLKVFKKNKIMSKTNVSY